MQDRQGEDKKRFWASPKKRRMRGERISPACRLSRLEIICRLFFTR